MLAISIHAPPRGATVAAVVDALSVLFQFTPLREGRPFADLLGSARRLFQFTPLREGRRAFSSILHPDGRNISIHAPPRGATKIMAEYTAAAAQFQFTPLREGRPIGKVIEQPGSLFQFTPLREGRRSGVRPPRRRPPISIHAPPRGATQKLNILREYFQFQFTPLREGRRPQEGQERCHHSYFNSRPSARGDLLQVQTEGKENISIHAPPRGATKNCERECAGIPNFNSRPSARGDDVFFRFNHSAI